jgi:hypothetical protein
MSTLAVNERAVEDYDDGDNDEPVDPKDIDVLFGRGGMTQHHFGNTWYRGLILENRPLYFASPKHDKLQVAKHVVQYCLGHKCQFLERRKNKHNHLWFPVSYKRAVEKTSQAFRDAHRYIEKSNPGQPVPREPHNMSPDSLREHLRQKAGTKPDQIRLHPPPRPPDFGRCFRDPVPNQSFIAPRPFVQNDIAEVAHQLSAWRSTAKEEQQQQQQQQPPPQARRYPTEPPIYEPQQMPSVQPQRPVACRPKFIPSKSTPQMHLLEVRRAAAASSMGRQMMPKMSSIVAPNNKATATTTVNRFLAYDQQSTTTVAAAAPPLSSSEATTNDQFDDSPNDQFDDAAAAAPASDQFDDAEEDPSSQIFSSADQERTLVR